MEVRVHEFESGVRRGVRAGSEAIVVVDALRASATVCALVSRRARVHPFAKVDEALAKRASGWLVAAEVGGERAPGADIDNSPSAALAMPDERLRGRDVALATSNGTRVMAAAAAAGGEGTPKVMVGSFVNASLLSERVRSWAPASVALIAAGRSEERAVEDYVCAQYLNSLLAGDRAAAEFLHANFYDAMFTAYPDIEARGLLPDVKLCLQPDAIPALPVLKGGCFSASE